MAALIFPSINVYAAALSVTAPSAVILEHETGKILYAKSPNMKRPPASTVKVLTALVVLDHLGLEDWVTVPASVEAIQPRKLYLKHGERLRVIDLLRASLMNSANDAASTLAIAVAGSEWKFGKMMTEKARKLGATHSNFVRASGLPAENQYATVYDLALIMRAASLNPVINSILNTKESSARTSDGKVYYLKSHNKMLWQRHVIGKTGWTKRAGYCYVGVVGSGSNKAVISLLGSKKLWTDVTQMVNAFSKAPLIDVSDEIDFGSRGAVVKRIQKKLKQLGFFRAKVTGYYGTQTEKAVRKFQKSKGLELDGVVGAQTRKLLGV